MKYNLIKAFFEYCYLDEEDIEELNKHNIKVEEWLKDDELEQRICLDELNTSQKEFIKAYLSSRNHKLVNEYNYVIFYN